MADFTISIDQNLLTRVESVVGINGRDPNFPNLLVRLIYKAVADIEFMGYAQAEGQGHELTVRQQYEAMQQRIRDKRAQLDNEFGLGGG